MKVFDTKPYRPWIGRLYWRVKLAEKRSEFKANPQDSGFSELREQDGLVDAAAEITSFAG